jgi:hypothetical protein
MFGGVSLNNTTHKNHYSKFYTTTHPKLYFGGKKFEIERKHKIKKRELFNRDKFSDDDNSFNKADVNQANSHVRSRVKGEAH